jgi:hypothetical protein
MMLIVPSNGSVSCNVQYVANLTTEAGWFEKNPRESPSHNNIQSPVIVSTQLFSSIIRKERDHETESSVYFFWVFVQITIFIW